MRKQKPVKERFWDKVPDRPRRKCWPWYGSRDQHGYGQLQGGRRQQGKIKAHRLAWEIRNGPIPEGMCVLHRCGEASCVNPSHLTLGTQYERAQLAMERGQMRGAHGTANARTKLTDEQVMAIRIFTYKGYSRQRLASFFGVADSTISNIVCGVRRRNVPGPLVRD